MSSTDGAEQDDSADLLRRVREGDEQAAQQLLDRFLHRLIGLARKKLPPQMNRRVDPEDVVQSALGSFFDHARHGDYEVRESHHLWRLLAAITVNKVRYQIRKHTAAKRTVGDEASVSETGSLYGLEPETLVQDPSVDHKFALKEQLKQCLTGRTPNQQKIILLLLEGRSDDEIEKQVGCTLRTVQRTKKLFRQQLEKALERTSSWKPHPSQ